MASSTTELIKEKLDVVEFLRGYMTLTAAGKNFKGLCPFHKEKTPSFMVSPERQTWHCFGCALGGDIFAFLMRYENLEFTDALKVLAEKTGVLLQRVNAADYHMTGLLYELNNAAKEFFRNELERSKEAGEYLKERGLTIETIQEFELGWALPQSEALSLHLLHSGYRPEDIIRAGLAFKTERGLQLDRFRGRVMFPIHNHIGKVVGFTGRVLPKYDDGKSGKYVNSPETPIFNKSRLLYGFWKSRNEIREAQKIFMVEGQMDFLMSYQAGVRYAVATSGTALTADHLRTLHRLADQLVISFDSDEAGITAGERAIDLAEANDMSVKVVSFAGAKDPAEAAESNPKNFREAVEAAKPAPEFYFDRYLPKGEFNSASRENITKLRIVLAKLKQMSSAVERSHWIKELSRRIYLEEKILLEELEKIGTQKTTRQNAETSVEVEEARPLTRRELVSQKLVSIASEHPTLVEECLQFMTPQYQQVVALLKTGARTSADPHTDTLLNLALLRSTGESKKEAQTLKEELIKEYIKEKRQLLTREVKKAEAEKDEAKLEKWLKELQELSLAELRIA